MIHSSVFSALKNKLKNEVSRNQAVQWFAAECSEAAGTGCVLWEEVSG